MTSRRHQCEICLDNSHGARDHGYQPKDKGGGKWDRGGKKGGKDKGGKGGKKGGKDGGKDKSGGKWW